MEGLSLATEKFIKLNLWVKTAAVFKSKVHKFSNISEQSHNFITYLYFASKICFYVVQSSIVRKLVVPDNAFIVGVPIECP